MDTKWKKWKSSIGFLAFFIGINLLIASVMEFAAASMDNHVGFGVSAKDKKAEKTQDYQYRKDFESYMANLLISFLDIAGGEYPSYSSETQMSKQGLKRYAESILEHLRDDKNLLYEISYDGKVLYTNMEHMDKQISPSIQHLPQGYNFYLHFDGQKVTAGKDGAEIDIYGDGIYRESESWRVPGYQNFTCKKIWNKAEVTMLVAKEPTLYIDSSGYFGKYNQIYHIYQVFQKGLSRKHRAQVFLGLSTLFFIIYIIFHKKKKEADLWIAERTKPLWFECKLLILAFPLLLISLPLRANPELMQEISIIATFWILYLFINDIRRNRQIYKTGIAAKLVFVCRGREAKLPAAQKMIYRLLPSFILSILLALCILLWTVLYFKQEYEGYFDETYRLPATVLFFLTLLLLSALFTAEYLAQKKNKRLGLELEQLGKTISDIQNGNHTEETPAYDSTLDLYSMVKDLEKIQDGIERAVEERTKSERMKVELVANVSHDIKTPLTSIISYIQLLKQEDDLPDYAKDYVRILDEKAERLKNMVLDVFSVSKAASGQLEIKKEELDFGKLLKQTLADMQEQIENSPVTVKTEFPDSPVTVLADGSRMYRVFQNLIANALKYSLENSRVYLTLQIENGNAIACVRNTSKEELRSDVDFTERFTRGDKSRTDGGSGLGLSIAKSFTEACGGIFHIEIIADLFVAAVTLPLADIH